VSTTMKGTVVEGWTLVKREDGNRGTWRSPSGRYLAAWEGPGQGFTLMDLKGEPFYVGFGMTQREAWSYDPPAAWGIEPTTR